MNEPENTSAPTSTDVARRPDVSGDFLAERGIDPAVWAARGCRRYERGDRWVRDEFRGFLPPTRLGTVTRIVNQSPGWIMPKHPIPGRPPIPPQLRPDKPVVVDQRGTWHWHGPIWCEHPVFPEEAGETLAGKPLPQRLLMYGAAAEAHTVSRHGGELVDLVHYHPPEAAKYVLLGDGARIDLHPLALERLAATDVVFFALEGTPKTDAILSAGACAFGVPSVTCWKSRELIEFAIEYLHGKTVLVVPDADWATNPQVEWQALKIRTLLRRRTVDAYVAAPPTEADCDPGDYHKGIDDFRGARHNLGELVLDNREPPARRDIDSALECLPYGTQRGSTLADALELLSLAAHDGTLRLSFPTLKNRLGIRHANRVVPVLQQLGAADTITVTHGSLHTVQEPIPGRKGHTLTVWERTPTISIEERYRADRRRSQLFAEEFWQRAAWTKLREDIDELKDWRRGLEERTEAA
jgi:hypothetical protein